MPNNDDEEQEKLAFTIEEAAKLASVGRTSLYNEIRSRRLKTRKVGRRRVVPRAELLRWLSHDLDES